MKHFLWIIGFLVGFYAGSSLASEEFDPAMYPEEAEAEYQASQGNMPSYPNTPIQRVMDTTESNMHSSVLASPKFIDDEDFNFDDVDSALADEEQAVPAGQNNAGTEVQQPQQAVNIPMIQRTPEPVTANEFDNTSGSSVSVDKNQPLTDNIKDNSSSGNIKLPVPDVKGTWINKLTAPISEGSKKGEETATSSGPNLESMVERSKKRNQRSNASVFDISGAMLRMTYAQVDETLTKRGFRRTTQKLDIPNFIRWRNEDKCRASGVIGYERLENCVIKIAKRDKHQYVETASYAKFDTKETIDVKFTSSFTNNKAYKIMYKSEAANITGNSQKAIYLRNIKIYDFWKKINQKYGNPDNRDDVIWGLGGNKPYMQAGTGKLILEDPMLRELDYTRMSREDQRFMNTNLYSF